MRPGLPIADCRLPIERPRTRLSIAKAFTLIEVMIAITIFMLVVAAIYSTWFMIVRASRVSQDAAAKVQRQRIAVRTLEDSLTGIESFQASLQYYSFIVENGDKASLAFTARVPDDFPRSGRFGDFNVRRLVYSVEPVVDQVDRSSENDLVLRQYPLLTGIDPDEQQTPFVLARNVQKFVIECWDTNTMDWATEWLETNSIPPLIRVNLTLGNGKVTAGVAETPGLEITRVIAVPSQTMPAQVQAPGMNLGGAAGGVGIAPPAMKSPGGSK
jgi:type II secretory pathway pseudopilin PulG